MKLFLAATAASLFAAWGWAVKQTVSSHWRAMKAGVELR